MPSGSGVFTAPDGRRLEIRDVWAHNLDEEMAKIRALVGEYPYIAMDTEFPGVVARPVSMYTSGSDYQYQTLRCNVDLLRIIQLGVTFADEDGRLPEGCPTWQFNFSFSLRDDMYAQDSIELLTRSGIDFAAHEVQGIPPDRFGELLMTSGMVLREEVKWLSFHSTYDFGYLLKLLTCAPLPAEEPHFFKLLHTYFPAMYDIKQMTRTIEPLKGGLNRLAEDLGVLRVGPMHQAGSDSLLTSSVFFALRAAYFDGHVDDEKYRGVLFGLGDAGFRSSIAH